MVKKLTVPSHTFQDTSDPNIKRFLDRDGNWTHYWIVDEKRFVPAVNHVLHLGFNKGPRFAEYLLSVTKEESKKRLETAGEEGSRTHEAIRQLIDGSKVTMTTKFYNELTGRQDSLNNGEWDNLIAFEAWCARYKPQVVSNEFSIYSKSRSYAGSPDALMILEVPLDDKVFPKECRGQKVLIMPDWKTSSAIHLEYKVQVGSYFKAMLEQEKFLKFTRFFPTDRIFTGVVRIGTKHKCGFEMEVWDLSKTMQNSELFDYSYQIYLEHESKFNPTVEQVPTQFFIRMPKAKVGRPKAKSGAKSEAAALKALKAPEEQAALPLGDNEKTK